MKLTLFAVIYLLTMLAIGYAVEYGTACTCLEVVQ